MMDDEVVGPGWQLDPEMRSGLRLDTIRSAASRGDWVTVVLEAEELLDEDADHVDALGLLATGLLELGDTENAAEAFEDHLKHAGPSAMVLAGLALARFESCEMVGAMEAAREAIRLDSALPDAHYTLALASERLGKSTQAAQGFVTANQLDPDAYPLPIPLDDATVIACVDAARHALPDALQDFWSEVPVQIEDEPSLEELVSEPPPLPPTVAGLYEGRPPVGPDVLTARPTALRVFRKNLGRCGSTQEIARQLALVLQQEALDWLGLPMDALEG